MEYLGNNGQQSYQENQIEAVLRDCGIEVVSETYNHFLTHCVFHGGRNTPSFEIDKKLGLWLCFSPACGETGTLLQLVTRLTNKTEFQALRMIIKYGKVSETDFAERLKTHITEPPVFKEWSQNRLDEMHSNFWLFPEPQEYMLKRGFEKDALEFFRVGYSAKQNMIAVPMHDPKGMPVGVVGRGLEGKDFKNSFNLPRKETLWNYHRAKAHESVIICESTFDAMRIHQAGHPNVVALLGGYVSANQFDLLAKSFSQILIMTDFDDKAKYIYVNCKKCKGLCSGHNPGRELGSAIASGLNNKKILWASCEPGIVYPHRAKDAGEMTDKEIDQCIQNAVSSYEYFTWNLS